MTEQEKNDILYIMGKLKQAWYFGEVSLDFEGEDDICEYSNYIVELKEKLDREIVPFG